MQTVTYYFADLHSLMNGYERIEDKISQMNKAINYAYPISSGKGLNKPALTVSVTANDDVIAELDKFGYNKK